MDILTQFESLNSIDPSAGWDDGLMRRINHSGNRPRKVFVNKIALVALLALFAVNIVAFSGILKNSGNQQENNMKSIANEFLIYTNSSKY